MRRTVAASAVALVLLTACTPGSTDAPGTPTASATATADPGAGPVVVQATYLDVPVEVEVAPVQVAGDVALLSVEYRIGTDAPAGATFAPGQALKTATGPVGATGIRLVDLEAGRVLLPGTDATNQPAVTRDHTTASAGTPATSQGLYAAPPGDSVAVLLPYLGLVRDVPVVRLDAGEELPVSAADLGREGEVTYAGATVDTFAVTFDDTSTTRVTPEQVTVALASDVLFGVDQAELTPEAVAVVDAAGAELASLGVDGGVEVVGHTDDVASEEYNLDLSLRRAQAVADRLAPALGGSAAISTKARGESEPAAPGTTPEARAANRRVEIRFTAPAAGAAVELTGGDMAVPPATGPTASGDSPVEAAGVAGFAVRATSVERVGAFLIGTLEVERTGAGPAQPTGLFGDYVQGLAISRGLKAYSMLAGAHNATLLGTATRFYPVDYARPGAAAGTDARAVVADEWVVASMAPGQTVTATVVWPDPGGDTVTIDVPQRFRITDVRVTRP